MRKCDECAYLLFGVHQLVIFVQKWVKILVTSEEHPVIQQYSQRN